ncbi:MULTISPECIES: class F sortase [unclassified Streptomyces]|uniref:Class F sortase n=1 Tax=Streptomyces sp. R33 TaxID=3238629 RepID=A0AB39Y350_9ACTN|nr:MULTISPECIES: class F sortase [unclassified Streptomyces]KJY45599.1 peptidase C60 [Streptomyces sp. NRRL S-444]KOY57899.1 peptidase C60 [Streptomyces sp. XY332]THA36019.1 class F sortase [Streptomyces sp. A1547]
MAHRVRPLLAAALLGPLALAALTGCGGAPAAPTPPPHIAAATAPAPAAASSAGAGAVPAAPLPASQPVRVRIPAAGVDAGPLLELGLAADGTVEVPSVADGDRIGWYTKAVTPGETGPAVLIGHFDTARGPAVLRNVSKIRTGDEITVSRADGTTAVFRVRELEQVDKKSFPTAKVYGNTARPELRLITCGGEITDGHRPDNIIVYADLVG